MTICKRIGASDIIAVVMLVIGAAMTVAAAAEPPHGPGLAVGQTFRDCAGCPEMIVIPRGEFMMGSEPGETNRNGVTAEFATRERPRHAVSLRSALAVGKYPVTRGEYARFVDATGYIGGACSDNSWRSSGIFQTDRHPVLCVSWDDAKAYAAWLSEVTGKSYRLLTEAEWEYAARAGTVTARYWGDDVGRGNANCRLCGSTWDNKSTSPVGSFAPNRFGLYDMAGNAWQWVDDCFVPDYAGAPSDASIAVVPSSDCPEHVMRGGSWNFLPSFVRSAHRLKDGRDFRSDYLGFRVARRP